ncbi:MAG: right-handed parallel beta-helix repeat-containing protein [Paraglaciecola polaris]|uniref:right-handed parallel beta-helix repeat-containing protein n=1 Tax=Paraglaciecola polaris TaxID=222814 RepID=UPI003001C5B3|tara:strand:+ start:15960 stop:17063 length:1104 start_codon:yes stop_codon:yes gene_type:complete
MQSVKIKRSFNASLGALVPVLFFVLIHFSLSSEAQEDIASRQTIHVSDINSLYQALQQANKKGMTDIMLAAGTYRLSKTIVVSASHIRLIGNSQEPSTTRIIGHGMRASNNVENIINVNAKHFTLDGIMLSDAGNHLIQISGERDADFPTLKNCVLQDSYEQLVKVSSGGRSKEASDYGVVDNCEFKYTQGIGPNYYIGGIDAHGSRGWIISNNVFKNIASPDKRVAEFAIHFWNGAVNNTVEKNIIINCDRGIGFGLQGRPAKGGAIVGNLIVHQDVNDPSADVGIILEQSPNTQILDNRIYLGHNYPNAIEYRFADTVNAVIIDNVTNKPIRKRNGAQARLFGNERKKDLVDIVTDEELLIINQQ